MSEVDMKELKKKLKNEKDVEIIDVRENEEVAQGKIPGAHHIPLGQIPGRVNEIDKNKHYYMVCRSGNRSGKAAMFLSEKGYNVTNVNGGMLEWEDEVEK
ncbi:rhodanese-like domain-containing protein [Alteribacillus iranensis]|uniref:Rhodanese-related sulfurtransferase n=1 Tax=Alteribacillus iranensis TaxID=930128 RepID=A0A1I2EXA8_9BACI|nr:rhodanese-like domain-containing protein [Alteribacillus iranensis]SFE97764.1 Rhodanese-related sulfurtransferase [Alteribacillus iranensis]